MTTFFILVLGGYFLMLILFLVGWNRATHQSRLTVESFKAITVLVPFRNESRNLDRLIRSLGKLNYPPELFEVIFINDHSEDDSVLQIEKHPVVNLRVIYLNESQQGKKSAITEGVSQSSHELIATTDADCEVPVNWLAEINRTFQDEKVKMVFGGVRIRSNGSTLSNIQAIEMTSLIGSGAATIGLGQLTMCNGANLAFRKSAFAKVNGFEGNLDIPSGDDEFLARKIAKAFPHAIQFAGEPDNAVSTAPLSTLRELIQQRTRWAGKWRFNQSVATKLLAVWVFFVQAAFVGMWLLVPLGIVDFRWALMLLGIKIAVEGAFLYLVSRFLRSYWNWLLFIVMQFLYPIYVICIGVLSQGNTFDWKGRRLSHKM